MSLGRPLEFDPNQALLAAMETFWRQGYEATSLQDLLAAMGISKSSFYQAFGSKHALFERCLHRFRERQVARMTATLAAAPRGIDFLRQFLLSLADEARAEVTPKGCLIMNTASEFAGRDASVGLLVQDSTRAFAAVLEQAVRRAQEEGDIAPHKDPQVLSRYLLTTLAGLKTMVKAGADARSVEQIAKVALAALG